MDDPLNQEQHAVGGHYFVKCFIKGLQNGTSLYTTDTYYELVAARRGAAVELKSIMNEVHLCTNWVLRFRGVNRVRFVTVKTFYPEFLIKKEKI